ncbi:MAG: hypothetical protein ABIF71_02330 [Planctomycetota bacterium]
MKPRSSRSDLAARLGLVLILAAGGCVERSLTVRPPDAMGPWAVRIDGRECGVAPCTVPFVAYGTREVTVTGPSGLATTAAVTLTRPWYEYFPIDFVSELILPLRLTASFEITPAVPYPIPIDLDGVEERAGQFRQAGRKEWHADAP